MAKKEDHKGNEKLNKVLEGIDPDKLNGDSSLSKLYRSTVRGLGTSHISWRRGMDSLVKHKEQNGEITPDQRIHKKGYLNNSLCADVLSWKVFIDGIKLLLMIPKNAIVRVRFQIIIDRKLSNGDIEEHVHSVTVHDE